MTCKLILILACCSAALAGCNTVSGGGSAIKAALSQPPSTASAGAYKCPPLVNYTPATAKAVGRELRALPKDDPVAGVIVDYRNMRRQCGAK